MEEKKSVFETLYQINVNEYIEKKNGLNYLSWSYAVAEIQKHYSDFKYEVKEFDGKPYLHDEDLGYMVFTSVTIQNDTKEMWLPVMDGANKAMKNKPYNYTVRNPNFKFAKLNAQDGKYYDKYGNVQEEFITKKVEVASMFDINTAIMRCLVKNISMFGLGLYIYAGEDLPEDLTPKITQEQIQFIVKTYKGLDFNRLMQANNLKDIADMPKQKADELVAKILEKSKTKDAGEGNV